ncbi:MAG: tetratricopeptide repeat protein [Fusobacteriaceae bacterium]
MRDKKINDNFDEEEIYLNLKKDYGKRLVAVKFLLIIAITVFVVLIGVKLFVGYKNKVAKMETTLKENQNLKMELEATKKNLDATKAQFDNELVKVEFDLAFGLAINKTTDEEVIKELKKMLENPKYDKFSYQVYFYIGKLVDTKYLDEKLKFFNMAIMLNPNFSDAYLQRGIVKFQKTDYAGAILDYSKALEFSPENSTIYLNRGVAKYKKSDIQGAMEDLSVSIQKNPNNSLAYFHRGTLYSLIKNYNAAIENFSKAIFINPKDYNSFYGRGLAKEALKNIDSARDDYRAAMKIAEQEDDLEIERLAGEKFRATIQPVKSTTPSNSVTKPATTKKLETKKVSSQRVVQGVKKK